MNVFRIVGDVSHYAAIGTIFLKIITSKSCKGISGREQNVGTLSSAPVLSLQSCLQLDGTCGSRQTP